MPYGLFRSEPSDDPDPGVEQLVEAMLVSANRNARCLSQEQIAATNQSQARSLSIRSTAPPTLATACEGLNPS